MRSYLEEQAKQDWKDIKQYILNIKDLSVEHLINESLKNMKHLKTGALYLKQEQWLNDYKNDYKNESVESLIATALEEKFYILQDEEEHEWNKHVVHSVINGKIWCDRWNNTEYK